MLIFSLVIVGLQVEVSLPRYRCIWKVAYSSHKQAYFIDKFCPCQRILFAISESWLFVSNHPCPVKADPMIFVKYDVCLRLVFPMTMVQGISRSLRRGSCGVVQTPYSRANSTVKSDSDSDCGNMHGQKSALDSGHGCSFSQSKCLFNNRSKSERGEVGRRYWYDGPQAVQTHFFYIKFRYSVVSLCSGSSAALNSTDKYFMDLKTLSPKGGLKYSAVCRIFSFVGWPNTCRLASSRLPQCQMTPSITRLSYQSSTPLMVSSFSSVYAPSASGGCLWSKWSGTLSEDLIAKNIDDPLSTSCTQNKSLCCPLAPRPRLLPCSAWYLEATAAETFETCDWIPLIYPIDPHLIFECFHSDSITFGISFSITNNLLADVGFKIKLVDQSRQCFKKYGESIAGLPMPSRALNFEGRSRRIWHCQAANKPRETIRSTHGFTSGFRGKTMATWCTYSVAFRNLWARGPKRRMPNENFELVLQIYAKKSGSINAGLQLHLPTTQNAGSLHDRNAYNR